MYPIEMFFSRAATLATPEAFARGFPTILPMPSASVSGSPARFAGWLSESIVPWLTASCSPEPVLG